MKELYFIYRQVQFITAILVTVFLVAGQLIYWNLFQIYQIGNITISILQQWKAFYYQLIIKLIPREILAYTVNPNVKSVIMALNALVLLYLAYYFISYYRSRCFKRNKFFDSIDSLNKAMRQLNPTLFEEFIEYTYKRMGYKTSKRVGFGAEVKKTKKDGIYGDGGKDVIIQRPFRKDILIQCKFYTIPVGVAIVREMFGILHHYKAGKVIIVTTSSFSRDAIKFAKGKPLELIDGAMLDAILKRL